MKAVPAFFYRLIALALMGSFLSSGCSPEWRRKFIRKRKSVAAQPILVLQSDEQATTPPHIRYQEHYAYWKSWHSELLGSLGQIRKRDLQYFNGAIGELRAMSEVLSGPPQERLRQILIELGEIREVLEKSPESSRAAASLRSRLEKLRREIDKKFHYSKVKKWVPPGKSSSGSS